MANSPNPEFISEIMKQDFGTTVLITNALSDRLLRKANESHAVKENLHSVSEEIPERFCGGAGGWDNFIERWEE